MSKQIEWTKQAGWHMASKVDQYCYLIMSTWPCRDKVVGRNWHHRQRWQVGIKLKAIRNLIIPVVKEDIVTLIITIHHKIHQGTRCLRTASTRERTTANIITIDNPSHSHTTTITIAVNKPLLLTINLSHIYQILTNTATPHQHHHQNKQISKNNRQRLDSSRHK